MKYTLAIAALAGLVAAQDFTGVPPCATDCLNAALKKAGCEPTDQACACKPETQNAIAGDSTFIVCLTGKCSASEVADTIAAGAALCSALTASPTGGATTTPPAATGSSSAAPTEEGTKTHPTTKAEPPKETSSAPPAPTTSRTPAGAAAGPVAGALALVLGAVAAL